MLDLGFVECVLGLFAVRRAAGGVEDFFFEQGVEHQFGAGLANDRGLALVGGRLELREQGLHSAMIGLEQLNGVALRIGGDVRGLGGLSRLAGFSLGPGR